MSKRREEAREAARKLREQEEAMRRRQRIGWISGGAAVALVIVSIAGYFIWSSQQPTNYATPAGVNSVGGKDAGITVAGTGPVKVEIYVDFLCPNCKAFEAANNATIDKLIADKKITLIWHPLDFLKGRTSPVGYSTLAASAAGCAADAGKLKQFGEALFANQPAEGGPGLTADEVVAIGTRIGITSPDFGTCVRDKAYAGWVTNLTQLASERGVAGTPTVYVDGKELKDDRGPQGIIAAVDAAAKAQASASPTATTTTSKKPSTSASAPAK